MVSPFIFKYQEAFVFILNDQYKFYQFVIGFGFRFVSFLIIKDTLPGCFPDPITVIVNTVFIRFKPYKLRINSVLTMRMVLPYNEKVLIMRGVRNNRF